MLAPELSPSGRCAAILPVNPSMQRALALSPSLRALTREEEKPYLSLSLYIYISKEFVSFRFVSFRGRAFPDPSDSIRFLLVFVRFVSFPVYYNIELAVSVRFVSCAWPFRFDSFPMIV